MVIQFCGLVLFAICTAKVVATESCLNNVSCEDNVKLWENLFIKINTILGETSRLADSQKELNESLAEIKEKQETQESKLSEFMERTEKQFTKLEERLAHQQIKLSYFMNQYLDNNAEWTTILRRQDGSVDFNRNLTEYQNGFGNVDGEFFIGLEKLHNLTTDGGPQELLVVLKDHENEKRIAKYDLFKIGDELQKYALLELGKYSGDAGDSLTYHKDMGFTTYDQDNDAYIDFNCATKYNGGWWYIACGNSILTGAYYPTTTTYGIFWDSWKWGLKFAEMKIRSKIIKVL